MTTGSARVAGPADIDRIVAILTTAFFHDPRWGPAFPDVERRAEQAAGLWRFYAVRPREPHFYLGLLGTHDAHRGQGRGMRLLAENLTAVDAHGAAAYLESSNPANDARYGRLGFSPHGKITAATGHVMTTMWRPGGL